MLTATQLIWRCAGEPKLADIEPADGSCWLCGGELDGCGMPYQKFVKPTFTDHDKAACPTSDYVCSACVFCADDHNQVLADMLRKDKPQRMRNYSHFVVNGEWVPLSKASKPQMIELLQHAELAVIADSGQKHIIFRAKPGMWQFEEQALVPDWWGFTRLFELISELYTVFNKTEIATGNYGMPRLRTFGLSRWRGLEEQIKPYRGSPVFDLAIFLAQREEDDGTRGASSQNTTSHTSEHELEHMGQQEAEVLDDLHRQRPKRGLHQQSGQVRQQSLFSDGYSCPWQEQGT